MGKFVKSSKKRKGVLILLVVGCLVLGARRSYALPAFMLRYSQDPFSRPEYRNRCSTCHIDPRGGGPRNAFGTAFEKNNHEVTPEFRLAWPDHFLFSIVSKSVATDNSEVQATFLANGRETLIRIGGRYYRLQSKQAKLTPLPAEDVAKITAEPSPEPSPPREPKLPFRKQPTFDHYLVNLPTTLGYERGEFSLRFTHRFTAPVLGCDQCAGIGALFGLDSFSYSSFGGEYGVTSWLAATVYRSPLAQTIEIGGVGQMLRQHGRSPLSVAMRLSIEGQGNFKEFHTVNLMFPISHSFSDIAAIFAVPLASFHANPFISHVTSTTPIGATQDNLSAMGLGGSIRFRPRSALVMEWTPRLSGYREAGSRNVFSFGLQRTTNGHVFELVLTNTVGTTTSRSVSLGQDGFALGFNVYRRLNRATIKP